MNIPEPAAVTAGPFRFEPVCSDGLYWLRYPHGDALFATYYEAERLLKFEVWMEGSELLAAQRQEIPAMVQAKAQRGADDALEYAQKLRRRLVEWEDEDA